MEPKPVSILFGGVVGLENPFKGTGFDPAAGVADADPDMALVATRGDAEEPSGTHGLKAVPDDVVKRLAHLVTVEGDEGDVVPRKDLQGDVAVLDLAAQESDGLVDQAV